MARLLVLRPEIDAETTATKARALGFDVVAVPLFEIRPINWTAPEPGSFDGLLLTSANAIRCAGDQLQRYRGLKVYAVGEATAAAAREAGFDLAATGDAGIDRLLASIDPHLRLLHLCGEHRRHASSARQKLSAVVVYRAEEIHGPDLSKAPGSLALVHSLRSGKRFAELVTDRGSISIAAISRAAAKGLGDGWRQLAVAKDPNDDALLALAAGLCKNAHLG